MAKSPKTRVRLLTDVRGLGQYVAGKFMDGPRAIAGATALVPPEIAESLHDARACEYIDTKEPEPEAPSNDRLQAIGEAIAELDADNAADWTEDGKPQVSAVERVLGSDVTAEERDHVWGLIKAGRSE